MASSSVATIGLNSRLRTASKTSEALARVVASKVKQNYEEDVWCNQVLSMMGTDEQARVEDEIEHLWGVLAANFWGLQTYGEIREMILWAGKEQETFREGVEKDIRRK